jgi:WhiB family redox-sensing transcriptional regulator
MAVVELLPRWVQQEWMELGSCKGQTQHFFAPHGEQAEAREVREALAGAICRSCQVVDTCREYARRNREQGFWGGENDEQRVEARRRANRTRLAATATA